jgi:hypothetical protein
MIENTIINPYNIVMEASKSYWKLLVKKRAFSKEHKEAFGLRRSG